MEYGYQLLFERVSDETIRIVLFDVDGNQKTIQDIFEIDEHNFRSVGRMIEVRTELRDEVGFIQTFDFGRCRLLRSKIERACHHVLAEKPLPKPCGVSASV